MIEKISLHFTERKLEDKLNEVIEEVNECSCKVDPYIESWRLAVQMVAAIHRTSPIDLMEDGLVHWQAYFLEKLKGGPE